MPDGTSQYIGGCGLHEAYEGVHFTLGKTMVAYFEPGYNDTDAQILSRLKHVDPKLVARINDHLGGSVTHVDDMTLVKVKSTRFSRLNLYRFSVGVGGGNGMYVVYNKIGEGARATYEIVADTFDGDVNFCDKKVWIK